MSDSMFLRIKIRFDIRFDVLQILRFDSIFESTFYKMIRFDSMLVSFECKIKDSIQKSINDIVENGTLTGRRSVLSLF